MISPSKPIIWESCVASEIATGCLMWLNVAMVLRPISRPKIALGVEELDLAVSVLKSLVSQSRSWRAWSHSLGFKSLVLHRWSCTFGLEQLGLAVLVLKSLILYLCSWRAWSHTFGLEELGLAQLHSWSLSHFWWSVADLDVMHPVLVKFRDRKLIYLMITLHETYWLNY